MRCWFYILVVVMLAGCTSTRSLSKKFSAKPDPVGTHFADASYANASIDTTALYGHTSLWTNLSLYRSKKDVLPEVSENAVIRLSLNHDNTLKVTAYEGAQSIAAFDIPVSRRGKYLILKNKTRMIPIPIIYFSVKENKTILAPLQNDRIGIYDYDDVSLWILVFAASKTGRAIYEYNAVKD